MKSNRVLIALVITLAILNVFSLGFIWYGHIKNHSKDFPRLKARSKSEMIMKKEIGLSQEQMDQFKKARRSHFEKLRPIETKLREEKKRLYQANVRNEKPESVSPILRRIGELQIEIDSLTYIHFAELRSYCDDSQIDDFDKMLAKMLRREFGRPRKERAD